MKTKYLFGAALLATAFTACTDEFLAEQNFANQENATYLNENFVLGVSLGDEVESRANWAGEQENTAAASQAANWVTKSVFSNVYFSPAYDETSTEIILSNTNAIKGDQVGLSLIGNNKAIANIPFFIAGYESNARLGNTTAPAAIYPLKQLTTDEITAKTDLYYLGAEESTTGKTALEYDNIVAQDAEELSDAALMVAQGTWAETFAASSKEFDPTKGLFKCHIPVMSGTYFAYFPFDKTLLTQGNIPVPTLDAFQIQTGSANNAHVAAKMFAYSSEMQSFDHTKVSGQFKMDKNAAVIFQVKLQNYKAAGSTPAPAAKTIKLVTISAEGDDDAFVLDGTIGFNGTAASFVDGTKTTATMGVELGTLSGSDWIPGLRVDAATTAETAQTVTGYIAAYPKADAAGAIIVRAYTTDGKVFERKLTANISSYKPGANKAPSITLNLAELPEETAENLVYNKETFKAALALTSDEVINVKLLGDVIIDEAVFAANDKKFKFEGGSLKFTTAAITTLPAEMTFECPVTIENNWTIGADKKVVFNGGVTNKGTMSVEAKANVSATTFTNAGTLKVESAVAANKAVFSATTLENTGIVNVNANSTFTVPTINNKKVNTAAGTLNVTNALAGTAVAIDNAAGTTLNWGVAEIPSTLTLTNAGTMNLSASATVTMKGATITNSGTITIPTTKRLDIATGTLNNNGDVIVVGKLNVLQEATVTNTGAFREVGTMSGYNFITNSGDAAEFVKVVNSADEFVAANNNDIYTAIEVATAIDNTSAVNVTSVEKDIILLANLKFNAVEEGEAVATEVANIYVNESVTLTSNAAGLKCANIVIEPILKEDPSDNTNVTLTANGTIKVTGKIETKKIAVPDTDPVVYLVGDFKMGTTASVKASTIETNGLTWTDYPVYGTTVE